MYTHKCAFGHTNAHTWTHIWTHTLKCTHRGTSLAVQWLRICASTAGHTGSIPGQGSSTCHVMWPKNKMHSQRHTCIHTCAHTHTCQELPEAQGSVSYSSLYSEGPAQSQLFFLILIIIYLFIFGCVGSSLLCAGFL